MRVTKYKLERKADFKPELVKEYAVNYSEANSLTSPEAIYWMLCDVFHLAYAAEEFVYMLAFNARLRCIGVFEVSHGESNKTYIDMRQILTRALLCNASAIVLAHNHPSGESSPSGDDNDMTEKLKKAGDIVGVQVLDHIVVSSSGYYSYAASTDILK